MTRPLRQRLGSLLGLADPAGHMKEDLARMRLALGRLESRLQPREGFSIHCRFREARDTCGKLLVILHEIYAAEAASA